jgi:hypothetical protein
MHMAEFYEKCECHIHSLDGALAEATIMEKTGDNQYVAVYNGVRCTAIFNPFVGKYYVDDKYGVITLGNDRERAPKTHDDERGR